MKTNKHWDMTITNSFWEESTRGQQSRALAICTWAQCPAGRSRPTRCAASGSWTVLGHKSGDVAFAAVYCNGKGGSALVLSLGKEWVNVPYWGECVPQFKLTRWLPGHREIPHVPLKLRSRGQQLNHRDIFAEGWVVSPRHSGVSLNNKQHICNASERNVIQEWFKALAKSKWVHLKCVSQTDLVF